MLLPLITICCLAPAAAFAFQHPLVTDSSETVTPSKYEAETAFEFSSNDEDGHKVTVLKIEETITAGIIPKLDAFIKVPLAHRSVDGGGNDGSGFEDFTAGVKWNFGHLNRASLAVKPFIVLPVGNENKGLGYGRSGFGADIIASTEIDNHAAIDYNVGFSHQGVKGDNDFTTFKCSAAGKVEVSKILKAVGEIAFSDSDATGSKTQAFLGFGAVYAAQKNLDVDLGLRLGLTRATEDYVLLAGATYKF